MLLGKNRIPRLVRIRPRHDTAATLTPTTASGFTSSVVGWNSIWFCVRSIVSLTPSLWLLSSHRTVSFRVVSPVQSPLTVVSRTVPALRMMTATAARTITNPQTLIHVPEELLPQGFRKERTRVLTHPESFSDKRSDESSSCVIYWMQRDVRTTDNWALVLAAHFAKSHHVPLRVVYTLPPPPHPARTKQLPPLLKDMPMTERHGHFLVGGLELVHAELQALHIPFHVLLPDSYDTVGQSFYQCAVEGFGARIVVSDFSPLREPRQWMECQTVPLLETARIPFVQVDAHNIVPVWTASTKREIGARTLRSKINKVIETYLQPPCPAVNSNDPSTVPSRALPAFDRATYEEYLQMDTSVPALDWAKPGTAAGMAQFQSFLRLGLKQYDSLRNDPTQPQVCSNLSPWINHGHISFQRITLEVKQLRTHATGSAAFIEEGVIRRELSDNYVYYEPNHYDNLQAAAGWAQETLQLHASDHREYVYTVEKLEQGESHDDLWNAAQFQLVREGGMHGFLRMYWAKKILEWTSSPELALRTAQYFNDKYALDGKDPNGFVGVGWSIMGIHDQGWQERPVFGKIRYMNYNGCKRKFDVQAFVAKYRGASENAQKVRGNSTKPLVSKANATKEPGSRKRPSTATARLSKKLK